MTSEASSALKAQVSKTLAINRCPTHGYWAITIDDDDTGVRVTPSKCCGRWDIVKVWPLEQCDLSSLVAALPGQENRSGERDFIEAVQDECLKSDTGQDWAREVVKRIARLCESRLVALPSPKVCGEQTHSHGIVPVAAQEPADWQPEWRDMLMQVVMSYDRADTFGPATELFSALTKARKALGLVKAKPLSSGRDGQGIDP